MTRILQAVLASLCAGLLLVIAVGLFVTNEDDFQTADVPPRTLDASKTFRPAFDMESAVATILERPLFSPTRDLPDPIPDTATTETPESAPPQLEARLAGVMIRPGVREALFARAGQKPIPVKVGAKVDGWTVAAIELDRVVLANAFSRQTVRPTPDAKPISRPASAIAARAALASAVNAMAPPRSSQSGSQVEK